MNGTTDNSTLGGNFTEDVLWNRLAPFIVSWYVIEKILVVLTNSFTIILLWKYATLETPSTIFIACLTITDLCSATALPFFLASILLPPGTGWIISCFSVFFIGVVTLTISSAILCAITINQLLYIRYALRYHSLVTLSRARKSVFAVVTLSLVLIAICLGVGYQNPTSPAGDCTPILAIRGPVTWVVVIPHYLFIIITLFCYINIGRISQESHKRRRVIDTVGTGPLTMVQSFKIELKIAKAMWTVFVVYIISHSVMVILPVSKQFLDRAALRNVYHLCRPINKVTSWINPLIYVWKSKRFRQHVHTFIRDCKPNRFNMY